MPRLSIIIVSYNVSPFLEQAIYAIYASDLPSSDYEIIVVDNQSSDASCEMVKTLFPSVHLIENKENTGFSRANNQGIAISKGEYVLLLNPDTVISEDTLRLCLSHMDNHLDAGGLGVKMVDGSGHFLPESKRGLPTPLASFYKIFGLSKLFPRHPRFGKYHLSYLSPDENHEVDVLSGAFMMIRSSVLEQIGGLDETFFMYGEDIDLSYRITLAGYKNLYFSGTSIIHYKGESTGKQSFRYVKVFYEAMLIFARKHFGLRVVGFSGLLIYAAVMVRASMSLLKRFWVATRGILVEFILMYGIYAGVARYWEVYNKWVVGGEYPTSYFLYHLPVYALFFIGGIALAGGYRRYFYGLNLWRGVFAGFVLLTLLYALLPEHLRYSRAILFLGATLGAAAISLLRTLWHAFKFNTFSLQSYKKKSIAFVGTTEEWESVNRILFPYAHEISQTGHILPDHTDEKGTSVWGRLQDLLPMISYFKIEELIISSSSIGNKKIISMIQDPMLKPLKINILGIRKHTIIGSYSKNNKGIVYQSGGLHQQWVPFGFHRIKRLTDVMVSLLLICMLPLGQVRRAGITAEKCREVIFGRKTWVGFSLSEDIRHTLSDAVFRLDELPGYDRISFQSALLHYINHYTWRLDVEILMAILFQKKGFPKNGT